MDITPPQTNLLFFNLAEDGPDVPELTDTMRTKCDGLNALFWLRKSISGSAKCCRLLADGSAAVGCADGIATGGGGRRVRIVTHLGVGPEDADALVAALTAELGGEAVAAVAEGAQNARL